MSSEKHFTNKGVLGYNGKDKIKIPVTAPTPTVPAVMSTETRHIFLAILNNSDFKIMDDSIQGNRLATAIDEAEGKDEIVIGEGVHDWLKKRAEQVCPAIFRVNGSIVYEFVREGYQKPHQSKEKTARKEEPDASAAE